MDLIFIIGMGLFLVSMMYWLPRMVGRVYGFFRIRRRVRDIINNN